MIVTPQFPQPALVLEGFVTPQMVSAIGSLWPLALILLGCVLLVVFRKPLGRLSSIILSKLESADSVDLKAGPVAASLTSAAREAIKEAVAEQTPKEEKTQDAETAAPDKSAPKDIEQPKTSNEWAAAMLDAMYSQNRTEVEQVYATMQEGEVDERQRQKNEALYLYVIFKLGDSSAISRLEELANRNVPPLADALADPFWWLGLCYQYSNELVKAAEAYKLAAEKQTDKTERAKNMVSSAECVFELGRDGEAFEIISKELKATTDPNASFALYSALASFYEKRDQHELRALALEKALEHVPNDSNAMFSAAYAYAEAGFERLSLFHYRNVLQFKPNHANALNNLGVQYERLAMSGLSINAYKEAQKLNNSLASANLASKYMNAGFSEEARIALDSGKNMKEVHPNVLVALSTLSEKQEREMNLREAIMGDSIRQQEFLRGFGARYFFSEGKASEFVGQWRFPYGVDVEIDVQQSLIEANWIIGGKKYKFDGTLNNRAAKLVMYRMTYGFLSKDLEMGFEKESDAFAYLSDDGRRLEVMTLKDNKHEFMTLNRIENEIVAHTPAMTASESPPALQLD